MVLTLIYSGSRPYTEIKVNGTPIGFSRGMSRNDVDESWIRQVIVPMIANGSKMWSVEGLKEEVVSKAMLEVVEESTPEPVAEPIAEPVVEKETPSIDFTVMTRAELMAWCRKNGIKTSNTDKKAGLIETINAHLEE